MTRRTVADVPATETVAIRLVPADFVVLGQHARNRDIPLSTLARHVVKAWIDAQPAPTKPARRASAAPATTPRSRTNARRSAP